MRQIDRGCEGEEVAANPREELNNVAKNIADCTELHLARRSITHLTDDMKAFRSLEVLWLNDNALSRLTNLDFNPTIKCLYAHNNRVETLKGSLSIFTFLHTLTVGNNRIDDLQASLGILRLMRHLRYLELSGNPLAEETGYRLLVIKNLPWLETLDMHKITDQERSAARRVSAPKRWEASAVGRSGDHERHVQELAAEETKSGPWQGRRGSISVPSLAACPDARWRQAMLQKELCRMRGFVKKRRILLKEWFQREDPRREKAVSQSLFTTCLRVHGLWSSSSQEEKNTNTFEKRTEISSSMKAKLSGEEGLLVGIILETFRTSTPQRAVALGRDQAHVGHSFINYVAFCAAVEPKHGGRDLDNQERELGKAWKSKSNENGVEDVNIGNRGQAGGRMSLCSRLGTSEKENFRNEEILAELRDTATAARAPMACEFTKMKSGGGSRQLDHWERLELKRAFKAQGGGNAATKSIAINRKQALAGLKNMETRGRRARLFELAPAPSIDEDSFNQLSATSGGENKSIPSKHPAAAELSVAEGADYNPRTNFDVLFEAAAASTVSSLPEAGSAAAIPSVASTTPINTKSNKTQSGGAGGDSGEGEQEMLADVQELLRVTEEGVVVPGGGMGPLDWGWLSREETVEKARRLYREAEHAQRRMLLLSDDESDSVRQEADCIRAKIADLTRNAARLENLPWESGSNEPLEYSECAEAETTTPSLKIKTLKQRTLLPPTPLGRVDVYLATEFHGDPFQREEKECYLNENDDRSNTASVSACDTSLGAHAGARGTPPSGIGGTKVAVTGRGRSGGEGLRDVGGEKRERLWVTKKVLTAG